MPAFPVAIALLAVSLAGSPAQADVLTVTTTADAGPGSLRDLIATATPDDVIRFAVLGTIELDSGPLQIEGSVDIEGPGADLLTLSGGGASRVVEVRPGASAWISKITISAGVARVGGVSFEDRRNQGGGILNEGALELEGVSLAGNDAPSGAAVSNRGTLRLSGCVVAENGRFGNEEAVIMNYGRSTIEDSDIVQNRTPVVRNHGTLRLLRSKIEWNSNAAGQLEYFSNHGSLSVHDSVLARNPGPFRNSGTAEIVRTRFENRGGETFAGIISTGQLYLSDSEMSGGRVFNLSGIWNQGVAMLHRFTLRDMYARRFAGIRNEGELEATNCTLSGLTGERSQAFSNSGTASIAGCTITNSGDLAFGPGFAPPVVHNTGTLTIQSSMIGDQLYIDRSPQNPSSFAGTDCLNEGTLVSLGDNIESDGSCDFDGPRDRIAKLELLPLADNGGIGRTHALQPSSPAIDAVPGANCLPVDQRGIARPQGSGCDVGSYERAAAWGKQLRASDDARAVCEEDLSVAGLENARLTAALAAARSDLDTDGVADSADRCPGSTPGNAVDSDGCSQLQFCASQGAGTPARHFHRGKTKKKTRGPARTLCNALDWRNDEPLAARPRDCRFDRRTRSCVPTPHTARRSHR